MKSHDPFWSKQYIVSSKIMQLEQRLSLIPSEGQQLSRDIPPLLYSLIQSSYLLGECRAT